MKNLILVLSLALSACATCREHPVACTVAVTIIAGSIAASVAHHEHSAAPPRVATTQPVSCAGGLCQ
jgi:hypothetical protein